MDMKAILWTVLVAMIPVIELRGAIPIGMSQGLTFWTAFFWGVVGNLLPVPFLIFFVRKVFSFLKAHFPGLRSFVERLEARGIEKGKNLTRFEWLGLMLLVAIPLPGTGAWTGCLVAAMLDIRIKRALSAILVGVIVAGLVVSFVTYGASALFSGIF